MGIKPRYPDFLIIGAMKSATSSLAADLRTHPCVAFPGGKEPGLLHREHAVTTEGRDAYAKLFQNARVDETIGDASTHGTLRLWMPTASNALKIIGPDVKIIYIMRDPIRRALSHHSHAYQRGGYPNVDDALMTDFLFTEASSYASMLRPWFDLFRAEQILPLRCEDYFQDRAGTVAAVLSHIGLDPQIDDSALERVHNSSKDSRQDGLLLRTVRYRRWTTFNERVRPKIPEWAVSPLRMIMSSSRIPPPPIPKRLTLETLVERFEPEVAALPGILGDRAPYWDLSATVNSLLAKSESA